MPFHSSANSFIGSKLSIQPYEGYGWGVVKKKMETEWIDVPVPFVAHIYDVIIHDGICRAFLVKIGLRIADIDLKWASLYPRSDLVIDIASRSVGCNILMADSLPFVDLDHDYSHPNFIRIEGYPFIRGFGNVSLLKQ